MNALSNIVKKGMIRVWRRRSGIGDRFIFNHKLTLSFIIETIICKLIFEDLKMPRNCLYSIYFLDKLSDLSFY